MYSLVPRLLFRPSPDGAPPLDSDQFMRRAICHNFVCPQMFLKNKDFTPVHLRDCVQWSNTITRGP